MRLDRIDIAQRLARADAELRTLRRATRELRQAGRAALEQRRRRIDELRRPGRHAQTRIGGSVIRRAVHSGFSRQLAEGDWSVVLTGPAVGLTRTTSVESPGVSD